MKTTKKAGFAVSIKEHKGEQKVFVTVSAFGTEITQALTAQAARNLAKLLNDGADIITQNHM